MDVALVAAWLGAASLTSLAVAPAAFAVLPSRSMAGALVGRVLPAVFYSGIAVAVVDVALERARPAASGHRARLVSACAMLVACAMAQLVVGPRIDRVRSSIPGAIESLAFDDPRRVLFGRLHALSVMWLGIAMLAAVVSIVLAARAGSAASPPSVGRMFHGST